MSSEEELRPEIEVQPEDNFLDFENTRGDRELFCPRKERTVLVVDGTCFSRLRDSGCCDCVCDQNFILARLTLLMLDILQELGLEKKADVQHG